MNYTKSSLKTSSLILFLLSSTSLLPFSLSTDLNHCDDDPGYTFGRYTTLDGEQITRTCAWLTEDPQLSQSRKDEWCNAQWLHNNLKDKCPETCFKEECLPIDKIGCTDKTVGDGTEWYDRGGEQYTCGWYSFGDNCNLFGNDFHNYNMTAKEACCICGGGDEIQL